MEAGHETAALRAGTRGDGGGLVKGGRGLQAA
jgi:hypothetical protein